MTGRTLILGTRTSRLARRQTERFADRLRAAWPGIEIRVHGVTTRGDRVLHRPLPEIGGKGLFTAELEAALEAGEIDLAVHSLKDLPTELPGGLALVGVPERADPRDVLVWPDAPAEELPPGAPPSRVLERLPAGSVVGTSSLRRRAQLLAHRPDCQVREIRGNVETRVRKCREGEYDAVVLAAAGLQRLGMHGAVTAVLEPPGWLPAPGQGALGIEGREGDEERRRLVAATEEAAAAAEVRAERALLAALEGGCQIPMGARATARGEDLAVHAAVFTLDGTRSARSSGRGSLEQAESVGHHVAASLLASGADGILAELRSREESGAESGGAESGGAEAPGGGAGGEADPA